VKGSGRGLTSDTVCLSPPRALPVYRTEGLHPPANPVTDTELQETIKASVWALGIHQQRKDRVSAGIQTGMLSINVNIIFF